jgi:signal transduction histidine kinase
MDNETTNSDLLQEEHTNKLARINRLDEIADSLRDFSRAERGEVLNHIDDAIDAIHWAIGTLEEEL